MVKLNLLILSKSVSGKDFTDLSVNPGVGGTEYLTVMLATLLAKKFPDLQITIYTKYQFIHDLGPTNLNVELIKSEKEVSFKGLTKCKWLVPVSVAWELHRLAVWKNMENVILWSHHPTDWRARWLSSDVSMVVSTGIYQFCSNRFVHPKHILIPNIFLRNLSRVEKSTKRTSDQFNIMYLGALLPVKGFHLLLMEWSEIKKRIPGAKLHVVGGMNLYGNDRDTTSKLPCDEEYAKTLNSIISSKKIDVASIKFYGTLGNERFDLYQDMDVAVINPSGRSESFSFNLHECMDFGLPVVASHDYGLNDVMCLLPGQGVKQFNSLTKILSRLYDNPAFMEQCQKRELVYIESLENRNTRVLQTWRSLILDEKVEKFNYEFNYIRFIAVLRSITVYPRLLFHWLKFVRVKIRGRL